MSRIAFITVILIGLALSAPAAAQSGIVYPLANQEVDERDDELRVDLRGAPHEVWAVSVNGVVWERAALNDEGELTVWVPAPATERVVLRASRDATSRAIVVWRRDGPSAGPEPPKVAQMSLDGPAILSPEAGAIIDSETLDIVMSGPPGGFGILRQDGEVIASFQFDDTGVALLPVASAWPRTVSLSLEVASKQVERRLTTVFRPPPPPGFRTMDHEGRTLVDPADGRGWRLLAYTVLTTTTIAAIYAPAFADAAEREPRQQPFGSQVRWNALASVLAVPVVGFVPYLFGEVETPFALPFAIAVGGGLASWGAAKLLADIDDPDSRLAWLAPPLASLVITFAAYEEAHATAFEDSWRIVPGPGPAGVSLRRSW